MGSRNSYEGIPNYLVKMIRVKAWQLLKNHGFNLSDLDDLEQELMAQLHLKMPEYDKSRAQLHTFLDRVIDNYAISLARRKSVEKRHFPHDLALDAPESESNSLPLRDQLSNDLYMERSGIGALHDADHVEMRIDIDCIISGLPCDLQGICRELKFGTVDQAAKALGVHRATIYRKLKTIRKHFENKGLFNDD